MQTLQFQTTPERQRLCREFLHKAVREGQVTTSIFLHNAIQLRAWAHWLQADPLQDTSGNTLLHSAATSGNSFLTAFLLNKDLPYISDRDRVLSKNMAGLTPLHLAAMSGSYEIAKQFVSLLAEEQSDINVTDYEDYAPLHYAAMKGSQDLVYLLLREGADVDAQTIRGDTPLHIAAQHNHFHIARQLVQHKANINTRNKANMTPLCIAAGHNYHDIVGFLLLKGANSSIQGKIGAYNVTPLHASAIRGGFESVAKLVDAGASTNSEDASGRTPLYFAAREGHLNVVEHLLKNGAQVDGFDPFFGAAVLDWGTAILKQTFDGHKTPLLAAVSQGKIDVVRYLVQHGASFYPQSNGATPFILAIEHEHNDIAEYLFDYEKPSQDTIWTALQTACICNNEHIVPFLLSKVGAGSFPFYLNPLRKTVGGKTILHIAVACGCEGILDLLCKQENLGFIEQKTDVDTWATGNKRKEQRANAGNTPLHLAARWADPDLKNFEFLNSEHGSSSAIARVLLENGAKISCKHPKTGQTPLHYAAKNGNQEVVKVLLENNATVESEDDQGRTPLYYALVNKHPEIGMLLVKNGAQIDPEGCYPLHAVSEKGIEISAKLLIRARAQIDRKDKNGETALHIAAKNGHYALAELLVNKGANTRIKNKWGQTAFDVAILYKNKSIADYLVLRMALIKHASREECELVKQIWQGKKDVNTREDWDRNTSLHYAAHNGSTQLARFLIERGARVTTQNKCGQMPIHIAAFCGNTPLVRVLLAAGSGNKSDSRAIFSDDIPDKEGKKPRNLAFDAGHAKLVALLYHHRAKQEEREISKTEQAILRNITQNKRLLTDADELYKHCPAYGR